MGKRTPQWDDDYSYPDDKGNDRFGLVVAIGVGACIALFLIFTLSGCGTQDDRIEIPACATEDGTPGASGPCLYDPATRSDGNGKGDAFILFPGGHQTTLTGLDDESCAVLTDKYKIPDNICVRRL